MQRGRTRILILLTLMIVLVVGNTSAQSIYNERILRAIGLNADEIGDVLEIEAETSDAMRRLRADLEIKQAELARLLVDDSPNMRQVERNLREAADIEVGIRMLEIERELAIREAIGSDRWSNIIQTLRARREELADRTAEQTAAARERVVRIQQELAARQRAILRALESGSLEGAEERVREELQEMQDQFQELQELIESWQ